MILLLTSVFLKPGQKMKTYAPQTTLTLNNIALFNAQVAILTSIVTTHTVLYRAAPEHVVE